MSVLRRSPRLAAAALANREEALLEQQVLTIYRILEEINGSAGNADVFLDAECFGRDDNFLAALQLIFREQFPHSRSHLKFDDHETRVRFIWWRAEDCDDAEEAEESEEECACCH